MAPLSLDKRLLILREVAGTKMRRNSRYCIFSRWTFVLALFFCVSAAQAQSSSDGSIYSRFGLGDLHAFSTSQIQAMGGGGTAMLAFNYVNSENPASWSDQYLTRAAIGFQYQGLRSTDASDNTSVLTQGTLNAVQFSFPLLSRKLGALVAFQPYSRMDYRVEVEGTLMPDDVISDTTQYLINYEGDGGLQKVVAGLGFRINRFVTVGASADFLFGVLENGRRTSFASTGFQQTNVVNSTRMTGFSGTVGTLITIPGLVGSQDLLTVGASASLPTTLRANRVRTLGDDLNRDTLSARIQGDVSIPVSLRLGASYVPDSRWVLVLDSRYEPWSQFESDFSFAGYETSGENLLTDRLRLSAGVEVTPAGGDALAPYFSRIGYRLGFYTDKSYANPIKDITLRTTALTAGLSLPTLFPGTRIDLNFEVGARGSTEQSLVRDTFYRLSANVNIGERWFQKQRLR